MFDKIYIQHGRGSKRQALLKLLAEEESTEVLALAYLYAKNFKDYGVDVTKAWDSATVNCSSLERAYHKGYEIGFHEARMQEVEREKLS